MSLTGVVFLLVAALESFLCIDGRSLLVVRGLLLALQTAGSAIGRRVAQRRGGPDLPWSSSSLVQLECGMLLHCTLRVCGIEAALERLTCMPPHLQNSSLRRNHSEEKEFMVAAFHDDRQGAWN